MKKTDASKSKKVKNLGTVAGSPKDRNPFWHPFCTIINKVYLDELDTSQLS
jgi:hypothetical protein